MCIYIYIIKIVTLSLWLPTLARVNFPAGTVRKELRIYTSVTFYDHRLPQQE